MLGEVVEDPGANVQPQPSINNDNQDGEAAKVQIGPVQDVLIASAEDPNLRLAKVIEIRNQKSDSSNTHCDFENRTLRMHPTL
eukprot:5655118-Amphidinium_carterae.2